MTYLNLDYAAIEKEYPLCISEISKWLMEKATIREGLKNLGIDLQTNKEMLSQIVANVIQHDPRKLYDFFDDKKIRIFITDHTEFPNLFYSFNSIERNSKSFDSRWKAEKNAFMEALSQLEKTLQS